jgi:hypothetical protein
MVQLEICEGKRRMQLKKYGKEYPSGTASVLRLCAPFKGTGRKIHGDSAFASVTTTSACYNLLGCYFDGPCKTATTLFPMKYFKSRPFTKRGDSETLTATRDGLELIAMSWQDSTMKTLIGSAGTSLPGKDAKRTRYKSHTT